MHSFPSQYFWYARHGRGDPVAASGIGAVVGAVEDDRQHAVGACWRCYAKGLAGQWLRFTRQLRSVDILEAGPE